MILYPKSCKLTQQTCSVYWKIERLKLNSTSFYWVEWGGVRVDLDRVVLVVLAMLLVGVSRFQPHLILYRQLVPWIDFPHVVLRNSLHSSFMIHDSWFIIHHSSQSQVNLGSIKKKCYSMAMIISGTSDLVNLVNLTLLVSGFRMAGPDGFIFHHIMRALCDERWMTNDEWWIDPGWGNRWKARNRNLVVKAWKIKAPGFQQIQIQFQFA